MNVDLGIFPCLALLVVLGLAWKVVRSPTTLAWFATKPSKEEQRRPFQFRIATLLFCTTLLATICAFHREDIIYHPREIHIEHRGGVRNEMTCVSYGLHRRRWGDNPGIVDFVVIETEPGNGPFSSRVGRSTSSGRQSAKLHIPDGKTIRLPGNVQLYEINDGVFRTLPGRVSIQQLESYLGQSWDNLKIDDLLATPIAEVAVP